MDELDIQLSDTRIFRYEIARKSKVITCMHVRIRLWQHAAKVMLLIQND